MTAALANGFNIASGILTNPFGFGLAATGVLSAVRGTDGDKFKQNIAWAAVITIAACYFAPAWFGLKAVAAKAVSAYKTYVSGPLGHILNPIAQYESGGVVNVLHGGGLFAPNASIAQVAATGKASGLFQTVPSTLKNVATKLGISHSTAYTPDIQARIGEQLIRETGLMNPSIPAKTVADRIADIFCVSAKSNGLPAAACQNSVAPISFAESVQNVLSARRELGLVF